MCERAWVCRGALLRWKASLAPAPQLSCDKTGPAAVENLHSGHRIQGAAHYIGPVRVIPLSPRSRKATGTYSHHPRAKRVFVQSSDGVRLENRRGIVIVRGRTWSLDTAATVKYKLLIHQARGLFLSL